MTENDRDLNDRIHEYMYTYTSWGSLLVISKLPIIILKNLICSIESFDIQNIIIIFARNISGVIMCNIKYYIDETAAYFGNMLGEKVALEPADKDLLEGIPMNVSSRFSFYKGCILGQHILMAYLKDGDSVPPAQLKKQLDIIRRQTQLVVVLITPCITSYNKVRLVAQKVNFVIPNRQMFLPSLLLDIKPDRKVGLDLKETIPPFAQCLLLYHLQIESIVGATGYGLSNKFDVSYATANKSLRWLVSKDLIKLEGTKTKTVQIDLSNRELWNKALPMLVSPIERLYYTDAILEGQQISGVNALASYTMLNEESRQCWAVTKKELKTLAVATDKQFGENEIQVWKYNPKMLSTEGVVDKLSLYLSLKDNDDERIQIELERLINEMSW